MNKHVIVDEISVLTFKCGHVSLVVLAFIGCLEISFSYKRKKYMFFSLYVRQQNVVLEI